jgi:hypothetical protein
VQEVVTCEAVYAESDVYGVVAGIDVGSSAIAPYVNDRYSSICLSASTDAFEIIPERLKVTIPELKAATTTRIPMFRITIAMSNSIRPKPASCRSRLYTSRSIGTQSGAQDPPFCCR